jgi:hypothetical protein
MLIEVISATGIDVFCSTTNALPGDEAIGYKLAIGIALLKSVYPYYTPVFSISLFMV